VPALDQLAVETFDASSTYGDKLHILHIYVVEPHPLGDPSPYSGEVWEAEYSDYSQPKTYDGRVTVAGVMQTSIGAKQMLLVDDLTPRPLNNPVWCTYGPCPNCAYLIRQDGIVEKTQRWVNVDDIKPFIDTLLR
jgi:hypothetical protein